MAETKLPLGIWAGCSKAHDLWAWTTRGEFNSAPHVCAGSMCDRYHVSLLGEEVACAA